MGRGRLYARRWGLLALCGVVGLAAAVGIARKPAPAKAAAVSISVTLSMGAVNYASAQLISSRIESPDLGFHAVIEWGRTTAYGSQDVFDTSQWWHYNSYDAYPVFLDHDADYHARVVLHMEDGSTVYSPDVSFHTRPNPVPILENSNHFLRFDGSGEVDQFSAVEVESAFDGGYATATGHVEWGTTPALGTTTPTLTSSPQIWESTGDPTGVGFQWGLGRECEGNMTIYWRYVVSNPVGVTTTPTESVAVPPIAPDNVICSTTTTTPTTTTGSATTTPPVTDETRPAMSSTALPAGVVGVPYRVVLPISKGSPPYTVELNGDTERMPPGLTLESNGVVDGTPTAEGGYGFNIKVFDQRYKIADGPASVFTLTMQISRAASTTASTTTAKTPPPRETKLILPNHRRTPGVINPAVTQKTIRTTICVSGWTKTMRPPLSYTNALKLKQMRQYGDKGSPSLYEEDQLIPLELGGAPRNPKNLWPEPRSQSKHSDPLETALRRHVCSGKITLSAARKQILAYKRKHG